jgi:hypothetical protein
LQLSGGLAILLQLDLVLSGGLAKEGSTPIYFLSPSARLGLAPSLHP